MGHRAHDEIIGFKLLGPLAPCTFHFRKTDTRLDRADDACRDVILQIEDIFDIALVSFRPDMIAAGCVDELGRDADTASRLPHAALHHVADTQLASHLGYADRTVSVDR